jgi:RHS repeat-associated protein
MDSTFCITNDPRFVGDPVDTLSGAVVDRMLDFRLIGPIELRWYRHYDSSQNHRQFAMGWGFTHEFDRTLCVDQDGITLNEPIGRTITFPRLWLDGDECSSAGVKLKRISLRKYVLSRHAEPSMEFEFVAPHARARLTRLFEGDHEVRFVHDKALKLKRIIDSNGRFIGIEEGDNDRLLSLSFEATANVPKLLLIAYHYDERGNLIATENSVGDGYAFAYDNANRMVRRRGRKGFQFYFSYDTQGRCTLATGDGQLYGVALDYKVPGRLTKVTRPDGGVWSYIFSSAGHLSEIHDPLGGVQKYVRDTMGKLLLELDPNGNTSKLVYDTSGAVVKKIDSLGYTESLPENPNAPDPLSYRIAANPAEYEYGRLLNVEGIRLPTAKQALAISIPQNARTLLSVLEPTTKADAKLVASFQVRPLGALWWPEPAQGRVFNDLGKLIEQCDDYGRKRLWTYDASGNLNNYVDFDGAKWAYDHGAWHYIRQIVNPVNATIKFSYTTAGEIESFEDASGELTQYGYDLKDQLIEVKRHGVVRETYRRDAVGNMLAKHATDGRELLRVEIGPGNLPLKRILTNGEVHTFQYDEAGLCLSANTKNDSLEFTYDQFGNRNSEKRNQRGIEHIFSGLNSLALSIYFNRFNITHRHLADGTHHIIDPGSKVHEFRHQACGVMERIFSNGSRETAQYNNTGRCLFKVVQSPKNRSWNRKYHWSGEGELKQTQDDLYGDIRYEYDAAHRLSSRYLGQKIEKYQFDITNNLVSQPSLENVRILSGNRLTEASGQCFTFNDRNHVETRKIGSDTSTYHYDSRDHLVRIDLPEGEWRAEYDALGRRIRKFWQGKTTEYFWNSDQLICEINSQGNLRIYVYTDTLAQTPFLILDYASLNALPETCKRYFVFSDQLGAPCRIEDENCTEAWSANLAPFGCAKISETAKIECNLRFPGHYLDVETGLHYNRFRYYDPLLGRYLQSDPWGITGGYNLYAYTPNPLGECDLRGLGDEGGKKKKKGDQDCEDNKPLHERKGWVDKYGEQKKITGDGSVDRDHQPSKAAIKKAAADEIAKRVEAGDMKKPTKAQMDEINKRIDKEAKSVVVDKDVHKDGPTHGYKNDSGRIAEDSQDLGKAAKRDADAMVKNAGAKDPDNVSKYKDAAKDIKKQTHESIMNDTNKIIDDIMTPN